MSAPATIAITRRFHFSASHRYWIDAWPPEENRARFGENVHTHGHNYVVEVTLTGPLDPVTGMVMNLTDVKRIVGRILERYDHRDLNRDHPAFATRLPTTEAIALTLAEEIAPELPRSVRLARLRVWETEDLYAEVIP